MKNIENAAKPKSVIAILPPRPFRKSGKVAQAAFRPHRREGKSCIPTVNQTFADSRIHPRKLARDLFSRAYEKWSARIHDGADFSRQFTRRGSADALD